MKPYLFTATATQELVIWADSEEEAAGFIGEAIDTFAWDMNGAEHDGEISEESVATYVRHGAQEFK